MQFLHYQYLILLIALLASVQTNAQVSAYPFTQLTTTYTPITGGQVLGSTTSDDQVFVDPAVPGGTFSGATGVGLPIGFNFTFNGTVYDRFAVNNNGWIVFGRSALTPAVNTQSSSGYTAISATSTAPAALQNRVAAFARDLQGQVGSELRYETIGTAPSRILVVQWTNYRKFVATGDNFNFQIRLHEAGNLIQVVYGTNTTTTTASPAPQVGLRGNLNTDFNNRTTTTNWSATTAGVTNAVTCAISTTVLPPSGLTFQWGLLLNNDAGISALNNPTIPMVAGVQPVDVTLKNFGGNTITSANIEWSAGGVPQTPTPFAGTLLTAGTTPISLGSYNFVAAPTVFKFWTSQPNGVVDALQANDTLQVLLCAALSGTYTVGAGGDFANFAAAVTALNTCGMSGPVTMQVLPGLYLTPLVLNATIQGLNATNRLTWDGSNKAATILTGGTNVTLNGVDYVTIQNFNLSNNGTANSWGVMLTANANYNHILNNRIQMAVGTSTSVAGVVSSGSTTSTTTAGNNANFTLVEGNIITGGYKGINFYGNTSVANYNNGNTARNNDISNVYSEGIFTFYQDSLVIEGNNIHDFTSPAHFGIFMVFTMNFDVIGNNVQVEDLGIYIDESNSQTFPARRALIANNMVNTKLNAAFYSFFARSTDFYHNTIVSETDGCIWDDVDNTIDIKNSIFINTGVTGFAFQSLTGTAMMGMNHNAFYKNPNNPTLISYGGAYANLAAWQAGPLGYDQNSVEGMPQFLSPTDLHVDGLLLNDKGVLTSVTTDIDGDMRPAGAFVDIGADEFTPPLNDAGVEDLVSPTLPIGAGFAQVVISVKNFGAAPLASFSVEWEINNIPQVAVPYQGLPIAPGATTNMTLANINFPVNTTSLHFWTTMPNGVMDERVENDTLFLDICPGLSGTYSVGTAFSDYATPAEAIYALMTCGVNGPVVMNFQSQTYTGAWTIGTIPGASAINTVTLNGQGATVTHNGTGTNTDATIVLDGVDYLTIKNFTIQSTGTSSAYGVLFTHGADHNILEDNNITVETTGLLINVVAVLASASYDASTGTETEGNNANWNIIRNNEISGGNSVILLEGGVSNFENVGNQIIGNDISGGRSYGIFADEQDSLVISGNNIHDITATTSDAIMLFDVQHYAVLGNKINSKDFGIAIQGGTTFADKATIGLIANNMVTCAAGGEALYVVDAHIVYVYHNTLSGTPAIYMDNQTNVDLRNNIFATTTNYCVNMVDPIVSTMNNNLYYINGTGSAVRFGTLNYPTLANWIATGFGYDNRSVSGNPNFVNGLHIGNALAMDTAAMTLAIPVLVDIDGDVRPMGPKSDIGADERSAVANDAMAAALVAPSGCGNAAHDIIVSIANVGANTLAGTPVKVNVSGAANATFNATLPLLTVGTTFDLNVGTINTLAGGTFNFEIIVSSGLDNNNSNDTLRLSVNILPGNQFALAMVGDTMVCEGLTATMAAAASYAPATIYWYDAAIGGNLVHVGNSFTTAPLTSAVTYYAEIDGCTSPRAMMTINVDNMGINVELGADLTACGGSTADIIPVITVSPATSIMWSDGTQFPILKVATTGMYYATVTNMFGCTHTDSVMVTVSPMPTVSETLVDVACGAGANGSIDLTVANGVSPYSYMWSNNATTEDLTGLTGGVYQVTVYDNGTTSNCAYIYSYIVTEPSAIFANIDGTTSSCSNLNGTINMTVFGGAGNYTFLWSTGDTLEDIIDVNSGTHTVTITDGNGCTTVTTASIAASNPIGITVDTIYDEILQIQGSIEISASGGNGTLQYLWNTGATTQDITGLTAGAYSVTVVDILTGCQTVLSNIIVAYRNPIAVNQIPSLNSFNLYPNPTDGRVWVNMTLAELMDVQLEILSITGQVLQSFEPRQSLEQNYEINLSEYPSGVYLARFIVGKEVMTHKIIVE